MPTPRRESAQGPTSASSYILERKLLRAYDQLLAQLTSALHRPADRQALYVQALGGNLAATQVRGAEKRLREGMPDLILKLTAPQQDEVAALLLTDAPDLLAVVGALVRLERNINYRDDDPRLSINDDGRLKAASMGRLSHEQYELTKPKYAKLGPPLVLEPIRPMPPVVLRTKKRGRRKPLPVLRGQYELWPLLAGGVKEGGL